jgi:hypothetical protein
VDRPCDLHHQSTHADDAAVDLDPVDIDDLFGQCLQDFAFIVERSRREDREGTAVKAPLGLPAFRRR